MKMRWFALCLSMSFFSCQTRGFDKTISDDSSDAVSQSLNAAEVFCPKGTAYQPELRQCATGVNPDKSVAFGPFTDAMSAKCKEPALKGGDGCDKPTWLVWFVKATRGTGICPLGTTLKDGVCEEKGEAFGPFSKKMVDACLRATGTTLEKCESTTPDCACAQNRWNANFARGLAKEAGGTLQQQESNPGSAGGAGVSLNVPYFNQCKNQYEPFNTCNNTSLAMVLGFYGKSITPDQIYCSLGKSNSVAAIADAARAYGYKATIAQPGSQDDVKRELDAGRPVIIGADFTGSVGHFVVAVGYNAKGFLINDPYGIWDQVTTSPNDGYGDNGCITAKSVLYTYAGMKIAGGSAGLYLVKISK